MSQLRIGTPEYDQAMIDAHDNSIQPDDGEDALADEALSSLNEDVQIAEQLEDEAEQQEQSDSVELPEGVSMDDLLAAYKAQQELAQQGTQDAPQEQSSELEESQKEQKEPEEDSTDPLEARVRDLEDQLTTEKIYAAAGGKDAYDQLRNAVEGQLDETQQALLNIALTEGSVEQAVAAVGLMQKFANMQQQSDTKINEGSLITGGKVSQGEYFTSTDEMVEAMSDPRYARTDAIGNKYRLEVQERCKYL